MGVIFVWTPIVDIANAINKTRSVPGKDLFPPPPSCLPVKQKARLLPGFLYLWKQKTPQNLYREK